MSGMDFETETPEKGEEEKKIDSTVRRMVREFRRIVFYLEVDPMKNVRIYYSTREPQTSKIAEAMAIELSSLGCHGVITGASVPLARHFRRILSRRHQ
jgi:hypothetical protein